MELSGITLWERERTGLGPSRIGSGRVGMKGLSGSITVDAAALAALERLLLLGRRELTLDARLGSDGAGTDGAGTATADITPDGPDVDDALDALLDGLWRPGSPGTTSG